MLLTLLDGVNIQYNYVEGRHPSSTCQMGFRSSQCFLI